MKRAAIATLFFTSCLLNNIKLLATELPTGVFQIDGIDSELPDDDLKPLNNIIQDSLVVGLGESIHTSGGYYRAKSRLIKHFVQNLGFRSVAIESNWTDVEIARDFVASCQGSSTIAVNSLFRVFQDIDVRDLLQWLCEFNRSHPNDKVSFFGFDIQQGWNDGRILSTYLKDKAPDRESSLMNGIVTCAGVKYKSSSEYFSSSEFQGIKSGQHPISVDDNDKCIKGLDAISKIVGQLPESTEKADAELALVSAKAFELQGFHLGWAMNRNDNSEMIASYEARDAGMAAVFLKRRSIFSHNKSTVLWAHNAHIAKKKTSLQVAFVPMGSHLNDVFGNRYAPIALDGFNVEINWPGTAAPIAPTSQDFIAYQLHQFGRPYLLLDLNNNGILAPGVDYGWDGEYIDGGEYYPRSIGVPAESFRAMFYLDHSEPMRYVP